MKKMHRQTDDKKFIKLSGGSRNNNVSHVSLKSTQKRPITSTKTNRVQAEKSSEVWRTVNNEIHHTIRNDERKLTEISLFSNSGFLNPADILPSSENRISPLDRNGALQDTAHSICNTLGEKQDELHRPQEQPVQPREKKVTFMFESTEPIHSSKRAGLTAPIKRQNFRNTYSKGSKSTVNSSNDTNDSTIPPQTPDLAVPETMVDTPATSVEGSDITSPRPPPNKRIVSANIDRVKLRTTRRKLKSCRSRSFHKSLDSSMIFQQTTRTPFSYRKPLKAAHPEVVTMISLEGSQSEETEKNDTKAENIAPKIQSSTLEDSKKDVNCNRKCHPSVSIRLRTPDHSPATGIIKFAGSTVSGTPFTQLNIEQRRNLYASTKSSQVLSMSASKEPPSIYQNTLLRTNVVQTKSLESENIESKFVCPENQSSLECAPLQSTKEKECWSSFYKMNKKGLFVSFDTILRGLLTPTEYRQRKDDLGVLTQEWEI